MAASRHAPLPLMGLLQTCAIGIPAVYLVVRLEILFAIAPVAMAVMTSLGLLTAFVAGLVAIAERRGDGLLTYSTISQCGLMFAALGMGAWVAAILLVAAHAVAKLGLALALASAPSGRGSIDTTRIHNPAVVYTGFAFAAGLAGLLPCAGAVAYLEVGLGLLVNGSVWSSGINFVGVAVVVATVAASSAYAFRLHYVVFQRPAKVGSEDGPEAGMYALALVPLAVLSVGLGGLALPELTGVARILEGSVAPLTRVSAGFGGLNQAFRIGPGTDWTPVSDGAQWALLLTTVGAATLTWKRSRSRWVGGDAPLVGAAAGLVRAACRLLAFERALWAALGRVLDLGTTVVNLGIDDIAIDRGSSLAGRIVAELGRRARRLGFGGPRNATLAALVGVAFVLGWVYLKPRAASLGPSVVHGFGGLEPALQSPSKSTRRAPVALEPAEGADTSGTEPGDDEEAVE